jgi:hypothetical protein
MQKGNNRCVNVAMAIIKKKAQHHSNVHATVKQIIQNDLECSLISYSRISQAHAFDMG